MKSCAIFFVLAVLAFELRAEDSKILGTWQSDRKATLDYIAENTKIPEDRLNLFKALFGKSSITYRKGGIGTIKTEAYEFRMKNDKLIQVPESVQKFTYVVLGETADQVVTKVTFPDTGDLDGMIEILNESPFSVINFLDENTYWIYVSSGIIELHAREYFKRVNDNKREQEDGGKRDK